MKPAQITTFDDFYDFLDDFATEAVPNTSYTLEEYLRSLLVELEKHQTGPPTFALFADIIVRALVTPPPNFDSKWREAQLPEDIASLANEADGYKLVRDTLLYQIAALHQLAESGQLDNKWRSFGVTLLDGHSWYNFDRADFWEAAAAGLRANHPIWQGWATLATLLRLGQIYE